MMGKRKRICVLGLGIFGRHVARHLAQEAEVLAVDRNQNVVNEIAEDVHRALCLDARDEESLRSVLSADFDEAVIAIGGDMEASILCALHLKNLGIPLVRAKARNDDHAAILEALGVDEIIFPERATAEELARRIANPNLVDFLPLAEDVSVMQIDPPETFVGYSLIDLNLRRRYGIHVIAIKAADRRSPLLLPPPEYTIRREDTLVVIGRQESLDRMRSARPPAGEEAEETAGENEAQETEEGTAEGEGGDASGQGETPA